MIQQNINELEEKSIFILREANAKLKNIAVLWSMGKDSTAVLYLIKKAFNKVIFPVIHIDNGIDFPETYEFRDNLAKKWKLNLIVAKSEIKKEVSGFSCCGANKTAALKKVLNDNGFDGIIVSIRRDEHGIRAKERYMSLRDKNFKWNYKNQNVEIWNNYVTKIDKGNHIRIHPILDWNEIDVWNYIKKQNIPINPLYLSKNKYRFRSLGCTHCTSPIKSNARTIDEIIKELKSTKIEERSGRQQDKEKEYIMEKLRSIGYM
ncbi:MAG: sulfate adenylyltransferase subunit CysD [Candidatus Marsarchaeota archaeon]|nr:sulfate adenylyltransferase subunit CysD [Candidatus Marsarchaeota archaeon]MCL5094804.1 sulfate adenylyltransferase subunit CysD [Candidatus Marsarchaeota archaeon]